MITEYNLNRELHYTIEHKLLIFQRLNKYYLDLRLHLRFFNSTVKEISYSLREPPIQV